MMEMERRRNCKTLESKTTRSPRPNSRSQVEESKDLYCVLSEEMTLKSLEVSFIYGTRPHGYKTFFMLNSTEHGIKTAIKY